MAVAKGDFQAPPGAVRGRSCDDPALHLRETGMPSVGQDRSTQHAISKLTFQSDYFGGGGQYLRSFFIVVFQGAFKVVTKEHFGYNICSLLHAKRHKVGIE